MNARSHTLEFAVDGRQVEEVTLSLFHTVLFHRSLGKFRYTNEGNYAIGAIGYEDVDCDFIDLTYVRCASDTLNHYLRKDVVNFTNALLNSDSSSGQIAMEFYNKKKQRFFLVETVPWEIWSLKLNLISLNTEAERQNYREKMGELVAEKMLQINEVMNRNEYVPLTPNQAELELTFDTRFPEVQPYLFKISYQSNGPPGNSVGTTVRKLLKDTLAL